MSQNQRSRRSRTATSVGSLRFQLSSSVYPFISEYESYSTQPYPNISFKNHQFKALHSSISFSTSLKS